MKKVIYMTTFLFCLISIVNAATINENSFVMPTKFLTTLPGNQGIVTTTIPDDMWGEILEGLPFTSTLPDGTVVTSTISWPGDVPVVTTTLPSGSTATTTLPPNWQQVLTTDVPFTTTLPPDHGGGVIVLATVPNLDPVVPVPTSMLLLGSGLIGLAGFSLKNRLFRSKK